MSAVRQILYVDSDSEARLLEERFEMRAITDRSSLFRLGLGVDAAVTSRIGATVGVELGSGAKSGGTGPGGTLTTVALSWAFGRR